MFGQNRRQRPAVPGVLQRQQRAKQLLPVFWQRFCENLDDAPTVQAAFPSVFLSENELLDATFPFLHDASGFGPDIGFQTPTTHGADNLAFRRDQHLTFFAHGQ